MRFIDLHIHTQASDGRDAPAAVVQKAAELKLAAVAITDHDTLDGLAEAEAAGQEFGVEVIRGCEFSVASDSGEIHLVGLWIPKQAHEIEEALQRLREYRGNRNIIIVQKLQEEGFDITYGDVVQQAGGSSVGRPHIAAALVEKGYSPSIKDAFTSYLGDGAKAHVAKKLLDVDVLMALLQKQGVTVSLAHAGLVRCTPQWLDTYVASLKEKGLGALEAFHSEHDKDTTARLLALAKKYDLLVTGGSDYHGAIKPNIHLGFGKGDLRIKEELLIKLKEHRRQHGLAI